MQTVAFVECMMMNNYISWHLKNREILVFGRYFNDYLCYLPDVSLCLHSACRWSKLSDFAPRSTKIKSRHLGSRPRLLSIRTNVSVVDTPPQLWGTSLQHTHAIWEVAVKREKLHKIYCSSEFRHFLKCLSTTDREQDYISFVNTVGLINSMTVTLE